MATEVPWKIVSLLREFTTRWSVLVPYRAHSSATLTALGADVIMMTRMSELGPIDPSRRHPMLPKDETEQDGKVPLAISVQDLRHVLEFPKREVGEDITPQIAAEMHTALFDKVHPLAIGALEQSWALSIQVARNALETHMDPVAEKDKIDHIVTQLSDHYKSHLYQLNRREVAALGLPVEEATDAEEDAMWALHQAFASLRVQGEAELNGQKMTAMGIGYIASPAALTVGLGHARSARWRRGLSRLPGRRGTRHRPHRPLRCLRRHRFRRRAGTGVLATDTDGALDARRVGALLERGVPQGRWADADRAVSWVLRHDEVHY